MERRRRERERQTERWVGTVNGTEEIDRLIGRGVRNGEIRRMHYCKIAKFHEMLFILWVRLFKNIYECMGSR